MSELADVLGTYDRRFEAQTFNEWSVAVPVLAAAARRLLALEPDQCGMCEGKGQISALIHGEWGLDECLFCHGKGWLYKPETMEAVAKVLHGFDAEVLKPGDASVSWQRVTAEPERSPWQAVAILDALRVLDQEAPNG